MHSQTVNPTSPGQPRSVRGQAGPDGQECRPSSPPPSQYIPQRRRTPPRPDLAPAVEPGGRGHSGTAGGALIALLRELTARGLAPAGMSLNRLEGSLILPGGLAIRYGCGWLGWPTGRTSERGRPLHTLHGAHDVAGAARRLARTPAASAVVGQAASGEVEA
jgi:hypothetical protein